MTEIDPDRMEAVVDQIQGSLAGAASVLMIHLGDQLGLYDALSSSGPATPEELARRTGHDRRYLREWMAQQAVVGLLSYDPESGRFTLSDEHALVLTSEETPYSFAGAFEAVAGMYAGVDDVARCFDTGEGLAWGEHDDHVHRGTARFFGAAYRQNLVDDWVPATGITDRLDAGGKFADVGCGQGVTTVLLASAYPKSTFVGIDPHEPSIEAARKRASDAGVADRVDFRVDDASDFGGGPYDGIWLFDVLHDLPSPSKALHHIRSQLADDGTLCLVEPAAADGMAENIGSNPAAALHYTASSFLCIPNSRVGSDGEALGAQAGGQLLGETVSAGGFAAFDRVAATPMHHVYVARG